MRKPTGYWTKELCQEEALKYKSRNEFRTNSGGAYSASYKNNWMDDICSHILFSKKKPNGYWSKEKCLEEALKYKTKSDFYKFSGSAYTASIEKNWLTDICSHMKFIGTKYIRCVYVYEFEDNHAYVGLTHDIMERNYSHNNSFNSPVFKHMQKSGLIP